MTTHKNIDYLANHTQYIEKIARWRTNEWSRYNPSITYSTSVSCFKEHCNYDKLPLTYLYFEKSEPVGMFSLRIEELPQYGHFKPWIGGLCVQKKFRSKGIGSILVNYAEEVVSSFHYKALYLFIFNLELQSWYENLGYESLKTDTFNNSPIIVMRKNIKT